MSSSRKVVNGAAAAAVPSSALSSLRLPLVSPARTVVTRKKRPSPNSNPHEGRSSRQQKQRGRRGGRKEANASASENAGDDTAGDVLVEPQSEIRTEDNSLVTKIDVIVLLEKLFDNDQDEVVAVLETLAFICKGRSGKRNGTWIHEKRGVQKVLATLLRFRENHGIQEAGFYVLQNMCAVVADEVVEKEIGECQVIKLVVIPALELEGDGCEAIKESVIGLLRNCCCLQENSQCFFDNGGPEKVINAMKVYNENPKILELGFYTLKIAHEQINDIDSFEARIRDSAGTKVLVSAYNGFIEGGELDVEELRGLWRFIHPFLKLAATVEANSI